MLSKQLRPRSAQVCSSTPSRRGRTQNDIISHDTVLGACECYWEHGEERRKGFKLASGRLLSRCLGKLLKNGMEGADTNAVRAAEVYGNAIDKNDVSAMVALGLLLEKGAEGVEKNAARVVELCERGIEVDQSVDAMYKLGKLMRDGRELRRMKRGL